MTALIAGLRALGVVKLASLALVAAVTLGLLAFLALRSADGPMALLYGDLDLREAGQVVDQLDRARIPHQSDATGTRILVPADQVARARLLLAKDGLPSGGSIGYEIFDRGDGLTASSFQQQLNQTRAMEGELARSIRMIQGVRAARVHIVMGKREPFARDRQEAQASIVLTMAGAARLDREGTQAILNLTAAAVPGLKAQNIALIDNHGTVLARAGQPTTAATIAASADEARRSTETRLARSVEEMLERSLGPGRVRAEASIELDYEQVHETQERFDPDGQVVRSQQSTTNSSKATEAPPAVTVANNLPNADAGANPSGTQEQKQDETTNYEVSKTIRTVAREQPQLKRQSVAVMVDGVMARGSDGAMTWAARPAGELASIAALVRGAIGYNEARGDKLEVVSMRFATAEEPAETGGAGLLDRFEKSDLLRMAETVFLGVVGLMALLLVFRPMVLKLATPGAGGQPALAAPDTSATGGTTLADGSPDRVVDLGSSTDPLPMSAIGKLATLIENHPQESVTVLRNWVLTEQGA